MAKLKVFLDPHWREMDELFAPEVLRQLHARFDIRWGKDQKASDDDLAIALPEIDVLIAEKPSLTAAQIRKAKNLTTIIEVSGAFPDGLDYAAAEISGVQILSCSPGFQDSVAEMCLAMMLSAGRGLITQHERFRRGEEEWLADKPETDFTLFGKTVGFLGYGAISRATHRLLRPFNPNVLAYDPWLDAADGVELRSLHDVLGQSQITIVAAVPTSENKNMISRRELAAMPDGALLIVLSRAHLVDFDALRDAVASGRIQAAIDVFPTEPVAADDPFRSARNVILSPHRAAAVSGGRQLIGAMILEDLIALSEGRSERRLSVADSKLVAKMSAVSDGAAVGALAKTR